jgi:hypothetical protein
MRALPSSCTSVMLVASIFPDRVEEVVPLVEELPPTVRRLALEPVSAAPLVANDRFDELALSDVGDVEPLVAALGRTRRLRLCVAAVARDVARLGGESGARVVVGRDGAARLDGDDAVVTLMPTALITLQRRFGLVPVRAQLARTLPERWSFERVNGGLRALAIGPATILRHPDGRYSARVYPAMSSLSIDVNGAPLSDAPQPLVDGDRLTIAGRGRTFTARAERPR